MHQFLRAIGFSDITKKQLNEVINNIIDKPEKLKVTKDSEAMNLPSCHVMWHPIWELQSEEYTTTMIALT